MLKEAELRFKRVNTCQECSKREVSCKNQGACSIVKKQLRDYNGIRFTSDCFDCALPVSIDSHSVCSFSCLYCFATSLIQKREEYNMPVGQTSLKKVENLFSGKGGKYFDVMRKALKYHKKVNGYPCPIQLGALTDPLDNIERQQGWFLRFAELVKKYNQPVRISTKGNLFLEDDYLDALKEKPELFWVNYSIITPDDKISKKVEKRAPPPSERIECIRNLNEIGVKTGLRFRPIIPGISDATSDYPKAYKTLIEQASEAGVNSISYEVLFMPSLTKDLRRKWEELEKISKMPLIKIYNSFGKKMACSRPSYKWTERIMNGIYKEAKKHKLVVGISDPCWKQLSDVGCCCGISGNDKVFGNWERESATNQLLLAKKGKILCEKDIIPDWAYEAPLSWIVNLGVGEKTVYKKKHKKWSDKLKENWNDMEKERSPLNYFQGALMPLKNRGRVCYKYVGLKKHHYKRVPFWKV